jgi:hypothetical protein
MMTRDDAQKILDAGRETAIKKFQELSAEIDRLRALAPDSPTTPSGQKPVFLKPEAKKRRRKPGQKAGHKGTARSRLRPEDAKRTVEHPLNECPKCGKCLKDQAAQKRPRVIEDMPDFTVEHVCHVNERKWCPDCQTMVEAPLTEALPGSVIGIRLAVFSAFLHYFVGVSMNNIKRLLEISSGHVVSIGGLFHIWNRLANLLEGEYDSIGERVRQSAVVKADETGWRIMGKLAWLWAFVGHNACFYFIYPFRKTKAVRSFLGKVFKGTLICDFWGAYNELRAKAKQRCLYHLFTEFKKTDQKTTSSLWKAWRKKMVRLLRDGLRLARKHATLSASDYEQARQHLLTRLDGMIQLNSTDDHIKRLSKRLSRHRNEIFTFLENPEEISPYNNDAERAIRPSVILRKICQQNRSWRGARVQAILMTIFRTAHMEGKNPFETTLELAKTAISHLKSAQNCNVELKEAA